jgi:hypothetical protein
LVLKDVSQVEINKLTADWKEITKVPDCGENSMVKCVDLWKLEK